MKALGCIKRGFPHKNNIKNILSSPFVRDFELKPICSENQPMLRTPFVRIILNMCEEVLGYFNLKNSFLVYFIQV